MWVWIRFGNCTFVSWLIDEDGRLLAVRCERIGNNNLLSSVLLQVFTALFSLLSQEAVDRVSPGLVTIRPFKLEESFRVRPGVCHSLHHNNQPHSHTTLLTSPSLQWQGQQSIVSASRPIRLWLQNKSSPIRPTTGPPRPPLAPAFFPGREMC